MAQPLHLAAGSGVWASSGNASLNVWAGQQSWRYWVSPYSRHRWPTEPPGTAQAELAASLVMDTAQGHGTVW